jgi:hypothetical protein
MYLDANNEELVVTNPGLYSVFYGARLANDVTVRLGHNGDFFGPDSAIDLEDPDSGYASAKVLLELEAYDRLSLQVMDDAINPGPGVYATITLYRLN